MRQIYARVYPPLSVDTEQFLLKDFIYGRYDLNTGTEAKPEENNTAIFNEIL